MKWTIEYDNGSSINDESFWEWWTVSDDTRSFKCSCEDDAKWLCDLLNQQTSDELSKKQNVKRSRR